jgi:hypothetical protein
VGFEPGKPWISQGLAAFNKLYARAPLGLSPDLCNHIVYGEPGFEDCMAPLVEGLKKREAEERAKVDKEKRRETVLKALSDAGFDTRKWPDWPSVDQFVKVRNLRV